MGQTNTITEKILRKLKISVLLVTAAEPEKEAVLRLMAPAKGEKLLYKYIGKNSCYTVGIYGNYLVAHVHCEEQGSIRPGASILTIKEAFDEIHPKIVVMPGIAYGANPEKQKIGDVLVSSRVQPYHSVRVSTTEEGDLIRENRNTLVEPGNVIRNQFINFDWCSSGDNNVWTGTILSGEELLDNKEYKEELMKQYAIYRGEYQDIIGGEMEGTGMAAAAIRNNNSNWMVVKAICDWADGNKSENKKEYQRLAAANSADFCFQLFETTLLEHIEGVKYIAKTQAGGNEVSVNGYAMFYKRRELGLSIRLLSKKSGIPEEELRKFEHVILLEGKPTFVKTSVETVKKLETALECNKFLTKSFTPEYIVHFFKNKEFGMMVPTKNFKAVFFDFDGTLTRSPGNLSSWELFWETLGYNRSICRQYHRKFTNKEIEHQEWCNKTAEYFIKARLDRNIVKEVSSTIHLLAGAVEALRIIKENHVRLYLCSGSAGDVVECVLGENITLFDDIKTNEFLYDRKNVLKKIVGTRYDFEGKAAYVKEIAEKLGIRPQECLFVGDSNNDKYVSSCGARTLVVNPKLTDGFDRNIWNYYLGEIEDLRKVLPIILPEIYTLDMV